MSCTKIYGSQDLN